MRLKKRLLLSSALSIVLSLVIIFITLLIIRDMIEEAGLVKAYSEIEYKVESLNVLIIRFPSLEDAGRTRQIKAIQGSLVNLLQFLEAVDIDKKSLLQQIRIDSNDLVYTLDEIISIPTWTLDAMSVERYNILVSHLLMMTQFISDNAHEMAEISRNRINAAQQKAGVLILTLIVMLVLINALISFFLGKSILRYQEALSESESRFRLATNAAKIGIFVRHLQTGEDYWSPEFLAIYGYGPDDNLPLKFNIPAAVHPQDLQEVLETRDRFFQEPESEFNSEHRIILPGGQIRWIMVRGRNELDIKGQPLSTYGLAMDITERKQVENALRESEERFRTVVERLSEGLMIFDEQGLIYQNAASLKIHGLENTPLTRLEHKNFPTIWKGWDETGHPLSIEEWPHSRVLRHEFFQNQVLRAVKVDTGREFWASYNGMPILRDGRMTIGFITIRDITEAKRLEKETQRLLSSVQEEKDKLSALINSIQDEVWFFNKDKKLILINPSIQKEFGSLDEELEEVAKRLTIFRSDGSLRPVEETPAFRALNGEVVKNLEEIIQMPGKGELRHRHVNSAPVRDKFGSIIGSVTVVRDITDLKQAELKLQQLNQSLELQVAERTALAEARAKQLQTLAVELIETEERERLRFAHLLHEDLQQLLAAAKMQVQAVADNLTFEPMLQYATELLEESIAKSRRLSQELSPTILHQAGLIAGLEWLGRHMQDQFGLHVEFELKTGPLMGPSAHKVFIYRAVQELLFNIVKHAGVKTAKVELTNSEDLVALTVSDHGRGFDPKVIQDDTRNLGFGLLTINERARYIGGAFTIESSPGQGSRFTLTVPNTAMNSGVFAAEETKTPQLNAIKSYSDTRRVLFVDDHQVMRQGLIKLIKSNSVIQVVGEAANGWEALEQARQLKPDVIVMDISMPEMDGIEATRRIKTELPQVRIIGLTMHDDPQLTGSMQQAGAEVTLSKTISAAELVAAILEDH